MRDHLKHPRHPRRGGGLFFGGLLVLAGTAVLLSQLGLLGGYDAWDFWPVILVLMGLFRLVSSTRTAGRVWGTALVAAGTLAQLHILGVVELQWGLVWPVGLIFLGIMIVVSSLTRRRRRPRTTSVSSDDALDINVTLGGRQERVDSHEFTGGEISCTMGGCEVDLREARMKEDSATIHLKALMAGVEIYVPRDWHVSIKGDPVMGAFEDKTRPTRDDGPHLIIEGSALMSGVEVKN